MKNPLHVHRWNFFVVCGLTLAALFLALKIGFIIHHDPQPAPIDSPTLTATAVLVLLAGTVKGTLLAIQSLGRAQTNARMRKQFQEQVAAQAKARQARAAELAADPARAQYAPLVERGEDWSDERITYQENPELTITCHYLQPIERAMRAAGINVAWFQGNVRYGAMSGGFCQTGACFSCGPTRQLCRVLSRRPHQRRVSGGILDL